MKKSENFDANWTHCIFSPDADMIVLGLLSRLDNVAVMRQEMVFNRVS
jgi:5'-3' exonuclease